MVDDADLLPDMLSADRATGTQLEEILEGLHGRHSTRAATPGAHPAEVIPSVHGR